MSEGKAGPVSKSHKSVLTLNEARAMLVAALGDNSQKYFKHVQEWFKLRTSKEVIDIVARRYLKHEGLIHYHELFILTLLNKVSGLNEKSLAAANQIVFPDGLVCPRMSKHYRPASPVQPLAEREAFQLDQNVKSDQNGKVHQNDPGKSLTPKAPPPSPTPVVNMAQDCCLPSQALIHGRFMLTTWDHGLEGVDSDAAELMLEATKTLLKNVLTAIINDIKPFQRSMWSHLYHVEHNTSVNHKQIWYKEGETYDEESLIEAYERNAMMNLLPKEGDPNYAPPEYYTDVPSMSTSYGPQPEEAESTLTAFNVFDSLKRNPHIIPHDSIITRTIMRASINMPHDEVIS